MRKRLLRRQHGGETVEFAFVSIMLLLVFAVFVEVGVAMSDKAVIADASRAAAREVIRGRTDDEARAAANSVLASMIAGWGGSGYQCDTTTCRIDTTNGTDAGDPISVTVSFPFQYRIVPAFLLGNVADIPLTGRTVMRMLKDR